MKNIGIVAFTARGYNLAEKIAESLKNTCSVDVFEKEKESAREYLEESFNKKDTFLFICAAGIAVRLIAPLIKSKDQDPAVVVMDEFGRFSIPLLSGHLGGANEAAAESGVNMRAVTSWTSVKSSWFHRQYCGKKRLAFPAVFPLKEKCRLL